MRVAHFTFLSTAALAVWLCLGFRVATPKSDAEKPFEKELLQVAKNYKSWGRVDDEARWAPRVVPVAESFGCPIQRQQGCQYARAKTVFDVREEP